jgi:hypothetical protein
MTLARSSTSIGLRSKTFGNVRHSRPVLTHIRDGLKSPEAAPHILIVTRRNL